MKIGLSLSFCVNDIIRGDVDIDEVACIMSSTKASTKEEWKNVLLDYEKYYWHGHEKEARAIIRQLLRSKRLVFPRLSINRYPMIYDGHWITQQDNVMEGRPSTANVY